MPYHVRLEVPWLPDSLNVSLRSHPMKRLRATKSWANYLCALLHDKKPRSPLKRAQLSLTRCSHRALDFDGLVGSLKPVVDALKAAGIISDDSWKVTGAWAVDQRFKPKAEGALLIIDVTEAPLESRDAAV